MDSQGSGRPQHKKRSVLKPMDGQLILILALCAFPMLLSRCRSDANAEASQGRRLILTIGPRLPGPRLDMLDVSGTGVIPDPRATAIPPAPPAK